MAAWECNQCTAVYAVDAPRCPQCGATDWREQGTPPPRKRAKPAADSAGDES